MDDWWKEAKEAAEQAAAAETGLHQEPEEQNYQIRRLLQVLSEVRSKYPPISSGNKPSEREKRIWILTAISLPIISVFYRWVFQLQWPIWVWIIINITLLSVYLCVELVDRKRFKHWNKEIFAKVQSSPLIEKLALGFNQFPDIYTYTPWPWRLFLGAKPRSLQEQMRSLAHNIDWYLLDEPRILVRPRWILKLLTYIPALIPLLFLLLGNTGIIPFGVGYSELMMRSMYIFILLMLIPSYFGQYEAMRHLFALDAMTSLFKERFG